MLTKTWKLFIIWFAICSSIVLAAPSATLRTPLITNDQVNVWRTVIYPGTRQSLTMHRHEHNRVIVALTDGTLKIKNQHGETHYLTLQAEHAYYLSRDIPGELHTDENISKHLIKLIVLEMNDAKQNTI